MRRWIGLPLLALAAAGGMRFGFRSARASGFASVAVQPDSQLQPGAKAPR